MKKFTIRKIPLQMLLGLLSDIYQSGADFVDINGIRNDNAKQDEITVSVPIQYMASEYMQNDLENTIMFPDPKLEDIEDIIRNA